MRSASATSASRAGDDRAAIEGRDDDAGTGRVEQRRPLRNRGDDVDDDTFVGEHLRQAVGRSATLGREQHAVALRTQRGEALGERRGVSDDGIERAGGEVRGCGPFGCGEHRYHCGPGLREQAVERQRQPRQPTLARDIARPPSPR